MTLVVRAPTGRARRAAPVTAGVPLAEGVCRGDRAWGLTDEAGRSVACQSKVTARWDDGSARWIAVSFLADVPAGGVARYTLARTEQAPSCGSVACYPLARTEQAPSYGDSVVLEAAGTRCVFPASGPLLLRELTADGRPALSRPGMRLFASSEDERRHEGTVEELRLVDHGPVFARVRFRGGFPRRLGLRFFGHFTLFSNGLLRLEVSLHNPRRARHAGGYWELGDPGSIQLREVSLALHLGSGLDELRWNVRPEQPLQSTRAADWLLYQESSGGENWQSPIHVDRTGGVPLSMRGYRIEYDGTVGSERRATPTVYCAGQEHSLALAAEEFWQKFPGSIHRAGDRLTLGILPREFPAPHELQAGEQTTRVFWLSATEGVRVGDCHEPLVAACETEQVHASRAVSFFPSSAVPRRESLSELLADALEGPHSIEAKREAIDEYGWRHYGEQWADHESVMHNPQQRTRASHFNNQYDPLHGMLVQFLRTGDARWWRLADPLARHLLDIDLYHTERDKPGYNRGLFWHTDHYFEAGLATHRSMARSMRDGDRHAPGGGPGAEHAYAAGLALYYHLTGDRRAAEAVVGLADWILAMDDGARHLLGVASSRPTGWASATGGQAYHGPGRGSGNAISVLLDGWLISGTIRYREAAERLIRRTIHPRDDLVARKLNNIEVRWSYTVHLQTLARYLELGRQFAIDPETAAYARESLLHYARWMAEHEGLALDRSEQLVYPTETWAAQDLRKGNVLLAAARHASPEECAMLRAAGERLLDGAWKQLMDRPTRHFTRPLALVLQQGYIETFLRSEEGARRIRSEETAPIDFGEPEPLVPQKQHIRQQLATPRGWLSLADCAIRPRRWHHVWRQLWIAEVMRRD